MTGINLEGDFHQLRHGDLVIEGCGWELDSVGTIWNVKNRRTQKPKKSKFEDWISCQLKKRGCRFPGFPICETKNRLFD